MPKKPFLNGFDFPEPSDIDNLPITPSDIATDPAPENIATPLKSVTIPEPVRIPIKNPKTTWTDASSSHPLGIFIDTFLGSNWISMTTDELQEMCEPDFAIEDIIEFSALPGVKLEKQKMQSALNTLNKGASIAKNLQQGQDLAKIKQAQQLTEDGEDNTKTYIWGFVPSSLDTLSSKDLQVQCPNCEIEFVVPALLKGGAS